MKLLGLRNIQFKYDDGNTGWTERAPFDGIIVTASPRHIPQELINQLADGGRMVIPVGPEDRQELTLVKKVGDEIETSVIELVRFVPLLGGRS